MGTTLACQVVVDSLDLSGEPAGLTLALGSPGRWLRAMPAMVGTAALDWVLAMVGATHVQVDDMLAATAPGGGAGADGVHCLPYFSPAGERAPFVESGARARLDGLTVHTTREELVRAVCEGIAFAARHCFEAAGLRGTVAVCGGGVRSRHWLQLFSDVLGREVRVAAKPEVGAYGAVLAGLGAAGSGVDNGVDAVDTGGWTEPGAEVQPDPGLVGVYAEMYERYRTRVDRARTEWKERAVSNVREAAGGRS